MNKLLSRFLSFFYVYSKNKNFFIRKKEVSDNFRSNGLFDLRIDYEMKLLRINFVD